MLDKNGKPAHALPFREIPALTGPYRAILVISHPIVGTIITGIASAAALCRVLPRVTSLEDIIWLAPEGYWTQWQEWEVGGADCDGGGEADGGGDGRGDSDGGGGEGEAGARRFNAQGGGAAAGAHAGETGEGLLRWGCGECAGGCGSWCFGYRYGSLFKAGWLGGITLGHIAGVEWHLDIKG